MGNKTEQGTPRLGYSTNQRALKGMEERQRNFYHPDTKAYNAEMQRKRREQLLRQFQFDRALGNIFNRRSLQDIEDLAPENIVYVIEHIDEHERGIETYNTEKGTEVSITIVEFTRRETSLNGVLGSDLKKD